jgi:hypothetical protein
MIRGMGDAQRAQLQAERPGDPFAMLWQMSRDPTDDLPEALRSQPRQVVRQLLCRR